jgi:type IV secretory pathway TraG/TraD family ATPase VirD4
MFRKRKGANTPQTNAAKTLSPATRATVVAILGLAVAALLWAQKPLLMNTYYTCNGQRIIVINCVDTSNKPYDDCIVQFPDRQRLPNGSFPSTSALRSGLIQTIQSCAVGGAVPKALINGNIPEGGGTTTTTTASTPSILTSVVTLIGTAMSSFFMLMFWVAVLGYIGWWAYKKIHYSRYLLIRRSNKQAIEEFGTADQATREKAIMEAFDSGSHTFELIGENRNPQYMLRFTLLRDIRTFKRQALESLRYAYVAYNRKLLDEEKFYTYRITAIYQGGDTEAVNPVYLGLLGFWRKMKKQGEIVRLRGAVQGFAQSNCIPNLYNVTFAAIQDLVRKNPSDEFYSEMLRRFMEGSRWLGIADIKRSVFKPKEPPDQFFQILGVLGGTSTVLTYSGDGSILTIAPPGQGKTTANVIPNLLHWPGAAMVLDVKGEIYDKTSKWRAANVGPVIRFSPLDPERSKCYNPLATIRRESLYIWEDASNAANMMIVPGYGGDKNKIFEDNARDILTAIIADLAFWNKPEDRPISKVLSILNRNGWNEFLDRLRKNPEVTAMQDLGVSLANEHPETLAQYLSVARSSMGSWKGERISRVTKQSDWHPLDLRNAKHPTIYICINPEDIKTYASLLRVFIAQHLNALFSQLPPKGSDPIMFCLDEFPQLGGMEPIETALEVGRGYGLRLWLLAQDYGQIEKSYTNAKGLMSKCLVRTFMNPTVESAAMIAEEIGKSGVSSGADDESSVSPQELAGPNFKDMQICVGSSSKPAKVFKMYYYNVKFFNDRVGSVDDAPSTSAAQTGAGAGAGI